MKTQSKTLWCDRCNRYEEFQMSFSWDNDSDDIAPIYRCRACHQRPDPLVLGGQGRIARELTSQAVLLAWCAIAALGVIVGVVIAALWGPR